MFTIKNRKDPNIFLNIYHNCMDIKKQAKVFYFSINLFQNKAVNRMALLFHLLRLNKINQVFHIFRSLNNSAL